MKCVHVKAGGGYDVLIDAGALAFAGKVTRAVSRGSVCALVTDENVNALYGDAAEESLAAEGFFTERIVLPAGEESKSPEQYLRLLERFSAPGLSREDPVVALGGGVVGDVAGFAAATYLRGVPLVMVPTTLLSMVDSSVGGKVGINLCSGKNRVGAFWQPRAVLCDPGVLASLPRAERICGMAEVLKYGMIADPTLLDTPTKCPDAELIARCVAIKRDFVERDERDEGVRMTLNFGHTFGHAIERLSDYAIPHGRAVAAGMEIVTRASAALGICGEETLERLSAALARHHLRTQLPFSAEALADAALADKKRRGGVITLVLPRAVGETVQNPIATDRLTDYARLGLGLAR